MASFLLKRGGESGRSLLPMLAGVWFAVLIGMGALVVPMGGEALGAVERSVMALAAAGAGAVAGWTMARRIAAARAEARLVDRFAKTAIRPFRLRDEMPGWLDQSLQETVIPDTHLMDLVERLRASIARRRLREAEGANHPAGAIPEHMGAALKTALARLRYLREPA